MDIELPYRVFAVDPATGKSGWAVLDIVSLHPLKIIIIATGYLDGEKLYRINKEMAAKYQRQYCILDALYDTYDQLLLKFDPDQVVCEGAFGHLHLAALISLTLAINTLRRASRNTIDKDIIEVPPTITKKAFTGSGGADKDHMRLAYQTNDYLLGTLADELITEHEIDAVAHGVGHVKRDILQTVTQLSAKDKRAARKEKLEKKKAKEEAKQIVAAP